jgi:hypothetical protein
MVSPMRLLAEGQFHKAFEIVDIGAETCFYLCQRSDSHVVYSSPPINKRLPSLTFPQERVIYGFIALLFTQQFPFILHTEPPCHSRYMACAAD